MSDFIHKLNDRIVAKDLDGIAELLQNRPQNMYLGGFLIVAALKDALAALDIIAAKSTSDDYNGALKSTTMIPDLHDKIKAAISRCFPGIQLQMMPEERSPCM